MYRNGVPVSLTCTLCIIHHWSQWSIGFYLWTTLLSILCSCWSFLWLQFDSRQKLKFSFSFLNQGFIAALHVFWSAVCYWITTKLNNRRIQLSVPLAFLLLWQASNRSFVETESRKSYGLLFETATISAW